MLKGEQSVEMRSAVAAQAQSAAARRAGHGRRRADPRAARAAARRGAASEAREQSVPAYVIFHDATLAAIAAAAAAGHRDALRRIRGIGAKKLERYGPALLELLRGA